MLISRSVSEETRRGPHTLRRDMRARQRGSLDKWDEAKTIIGFQPVCLLLFLRSFFILFKRRDYSAFSPSSFGIVNDFFCFKTPSRQRDYFRVLFVNRFAVCARPIYFQQPPRATKIYSPSFFRRQRNSHWPRLVAQCFQETMALIFSYSVTIVYSFWEGRKE